MLWQSGYKSHAQRPEDYVGRKRAKEDKDAAAELIGSDYSPKDSEAKDILRECGVKNPHVQDVVIQEAKIAATHFHIAYNNYVLRNGLRRLSLLSKSRRSLTDSTAVEHVDEVVDGEILFKSEPLLSLGIWILPSAGCNVRAVVGD